MRRMIAALNVSLEGFIEGPRGELEWAADDDDESFRFMFEMLDTVDTVVLGRVMYPAYEDYWLSVLAKPTSSTKNDLAYARFADATPHVVLSRTLEQVRWKTTRIARDIDEIRNLKQQRGKDIYVAGGATLVSSLMNHGLLDEVRLVVNPLILGGGKPLFKDVKERHRLTLRDATPFRSGRVALRYRNG
jgi:dihydrofolate reductase